MTCSPASRRERWSSNPERHGASPWDWPWPCRRDISARCSPAAAWPPGRGCAQPTAWGWWTATTGGKTWCPSTTTAVSPRPSATATGWPRWWCCPIWRWTSPRRRNWMRRNGARGASAVREMMLRARCLPAGIAVRASAGNMPPAYFQTAAGLRQYREMMLRARCLPAGIAAEARNRFPLQGGASDAAKEARIPS